MATDESGLSDEVLVEVTREEPDEEPEEPEDELPQEP